MPLELSLEAGETRGIDRDADPAASRMWFDTGKGKSSSDVTALSKSKSKGDIDVSTAMARLMRASTDVDPVLLDVAALHKAITEAERAGVDQEMLKKAKKKLAKAEEEQKKARKNEATEELKRLNAARPTTLDEWWVVFSGLQKYIAMGEAADVERRLIDSAKAMLRKAEQAKAGLASDVRTVALAELRRVTAISLAEAAVDDLRQALAAAAKTGVAQDVLQPAQARAPRDSPRMTRRPRQPPAEAHPPLTTAD